MEIDDHLLLPHLTTKYLFFQVSISIFYIIVLLFTFREETVSWFHFAGGCIMSGTAPVFGVYNDSNGCSRRWQPFSECWSRIYPLNQQILQVALITALVATVVLTFVWLFPNSVDAYYSLFLGFFLGHSIFGLGFLILRALHGEQ
jgi:hypothetical protein